MIPAEFEEKSYEGPLYNQLERGNPELFTPGQVLENSLGFDAGLFVAQAALWQTLGYKNPLRGAALAYYDVESDRYTIHAGSGGAVRQKSELATVLGVPSEKIHVMSFDVGGNFGTRNRVYVEYGLVLWAARKLGRPVKFRADRSEAFLRALEVGFNISATPHGNELILRRNPPR